MSVENQSVLFARQLAKANDHSVSSWHRELEIAKALKIAQKDENYEDEAIGLEKLGDVYAERGLEQESSTMFARLDQLILATALYNSSFVRATRDEMKEELRAKLQRLEEGVIKQCGKDIDNDDFKYDIDRDHKKELNEFRESCRNKLNSVQRQFEVFASPLHDTDADSEMRRAKKIEEMFSEIQSFVKQFVSRLLDECVQVLGPPPEEVSYALVAFGSFPRREVTPYSDIESALLIEEGKNTSAVKEYFVKLTEYFNFKVLNLQETILPSMSIASLNDLNDEINSLKIEHKCTATTCTDKENDDDPTASRDNSSVDEDRDWFYDNEMRGFSVDGRMSKACKTPLGCLVRGRGQSEDLIKTPTEMAELYVKSLEYDRDVSHEWDNNDYNLSTVLSNVSFLYGNDQSLVDIYDGLVMSMTESTDGDTKLNPREASAVACLRNALEEFQFSLNSSEIGLISSIKKKLYRVVDLLLVNLGKLQYPGIVENSPWNILERLNKDGRISSEAFHNLMVVAGIVNEVRLMAYLRSGKQDELFSFFDQSTDIDYELTKNFFLRFFYTVFPFQRAVKNFLSRFLENSSVDAILFPPEEQFYEYSHLTSAVAISLTSYRFFHEVMGKFEEAIHSVEDERSRRLCLAYLSCLHPDYSFEFLKELLEHTPSSGDEESSDWRIFSFLVASLASFHQDNVENVERFLAAAANESSRLPGLDASNPGEPSRSQVVVQSYEILVRGLLKLRQARYEEAVREFEAARATYERTTRVEKGRCSLFVLFCIFMSGRCHVQLGHYEDSSIETAMQLGKIYTGNQEYMRILYHAYVGMVSLQREQNAQTFKHCEKIVELFLRFRCPMGQELWASIPAQGVILVALFLGLHYRDMGRVDDALGVFQLGSTRLISKALEFCEKKNHVGTKSFETAKMYIDAFKAVFNLLEAECLHEKGNDQEMWTKLGEAVAKLAKYRGKIEPVELREVFQSTATRGSSLPGEEESHAVWRMNLNSSPLAPRVVDTLSLGPLLETWCDKITMLMQYILYTIERDVHRELIEKGTPLIMMLAMLSSNPGVLENFQSNPFQVLEMFIPMLRQTPAAGQMLSGVFASANAQRTAMLGLIKTGVAEIDRYAVEFTDGFIELFILYLRLSLCHDLVNSFDLFK